MATTAEELEQQINELTGRTVSLDPKDFVNNKRLSWPEVIDRINAGLGFTEDEILPTIPDGITATEFYNAVGISATDFSQPGVSDFIGTVTSAGIPSQTNNVTTVADEQLAQQVSDQARTIQLSSGEATSADFEEPSTLGVIGYGPQMDSFAGILGLIPGVSTLMNIVTPDSPFKVASSVFGEMLGGQPSGYEAYARLDDAQQAYAALERDEITDEQFNAFMSNGPGMYYEDGAKATGDKWERSLEDRGTGSIDPLLGLGGDYMPKTIDEIIALNRQRLLSDQFVDSDNPTSTGVPSDVVGWAGDARTGVGITKSGQRWTFADGYMLHDGATKGDGRFFKGKDGVEGMMLRKEALEEQLKEFKETGARKIPGVTPTNAPTSGNDRGQPNAFLRDGIDYNSIQTVSYGPTDPNKQVDVKIGDPRSIEFGQADMLATDSGGTTTRGGLGDKAVSVRGLGDFQSNEFAMPEGLLDLSPEEQLARDAAKEPDPVVSTSDAELRRDAAMGPDFRNVPSDLAKVGTSEREDLDPFSLIPSSQVMREQAPAQLQYELQGQEGMEQASRDATAAQMRNIGNQVYYEESIGIRSPGTEGVQAPAGTMGTAGAGWQGWEADQWWADDDTSTGDDSGFSGWGDFGMSDDADVGWASGGRVGMKNGSEVAEPFLRSSYPPKDIIQAPYIPDNQGDGFELLPDDIPKDRNVDRYHNQDPLPPHMNLLYDDPDKYFDVQREEDNEKYSKQVSKDINTARSMLKASMKKERDFYKTVQKGSKLSAIDEKTAQKLMADSNMARRIYVDAMKEKGPYALISHVKMLYDLPPITSKQEKKLADQIKRRGDVPVHEFMNSLVTHWPSSNPKDVAPIDRYARSKEMQEGGPVEGAAADMANLGMINAPAAPPQQGGQQSVKDDIPREADEGDYILPYETVLLVGLKDLNRYAREAIDLAMKNNIDLGGTDLDPTDDVPIKVSNYEYHIPKVLVPFFGGGKKYLDKIREEGLALRKRLEEEKQPSAQEQQPQVPMQEAPPQMAQAAPAPQPPMMHTGGFVLSPDEKKQPTTEAMLEADTTQAQESSYNQMQALERTRKQAQQPPMVDPTGKIVQQGFAAPQGYQDGSMVEDPDLMVAVAAKTEPPMPDWANRALDPKTPVMMNEETGEPQTLGLITDKINDMFHVYPTIRMVGKDLKRYDADEALSIAMKKKDSIKFKTEEEANSWSDRLVNQISELRNLQNGQPDMPPTVEEVSPPMPEQVLTAMPEEELPPMPEEEMQGFAQQQPMIA